MGTTNSLSLQKSLHLPPPLVSRGQTLGSLAECPRDYSSQPSLLPLPLFPHILALHSPSTRRTTIRNGSTVIAASSLSRPRARMPSKNLFPSIGCLDTSLRLPNSICVESTPNRESASSRGLEEANAIEKNDRDNNMLIIGTSLRVHSSRRPIPGKILMSANQIRAIADRAHVSRELCARAPQASQGI